MNISIITPVLLEGDAVSNDVRGMYRALKRAGHEVKLFAEECHADLPFGPIGKASEWLGPDDCCIYHHSMGCGAGVALLRTLKCRKLVRYHGVTPAHHYQDDLKTRLECNKGVYQLRVLAEMGCEFIATTNFTARDLLAVQADAPLAIVSPYNQIDALFQATPDYLSPLRYSDAIYNVLVVGRVVPNKNLLKAARAFTIFQEEVRGRARLLIVGDPGDFRYARQVLASANELGNADSVFVVGKVSLRQLRAYYLLADALLLVSEHEGFGVPLVEAMAMRVPAVASATTALPETGGDAVLYADPADEEAIAAALGRAVSDLDLREELMICGWERYRERFANDKIDQAIQETVFDYRGERVTPFQT
ncbi:MAG: glycosyltransferase [Candidatus Acidiferrum sp.]